MDIYSKRKMSQVNYDNCPCKKKCKPVVALANILPVDVCNLIGGYIRVTCFNCWYLMDEEEERFNNRKMYYQALKSYCKNNENEVCIILRKCLDIEDFKKIKRYGFSVPNLNSWWSYRSRSYYMRNILSDLIEIYTDQLIKGYEHYCCEYSMSCYSGCIDGEIKYGTN